MTLGISIIYNQLFIQQMFRKLLFASILIASLMLVKLLFEEPQPIHTKYNVRVYRDSQGIPRVFGRDSQDLAFGLGYVQAQDRLWTLHVRKKLMAGRLAEIFGTQVLQLDMEMRNIQFTKIGKMFQSYLGKRQRTYLQAYAEGINAYVRNQKLMPIEFYIFWTEWEDWGPVDSLTCAAFTSFSLDFDWMFEIARQRLLQTVGFQLARQIIPFGEENLYRQVTIINDQQLKERGKYKFYNSSEQINILKEHWANKNLSLGHIRIPRQKFKGTGSNAWVIGGQHAKSGRPILANDPHLGTLIPSILYFAQLNFLDQQNQIDHNLFGAMVDGFPFLTFAVTKKHAFGSTASYVDTKDVYYETIRQSPQGKLQYLFEGKWLDFSVRREVFKVKFGQDVVQNYYHTHRGPVLMHLFDDLHPKYGFPLSEKYKKDYVLSLDCSVYKEDNSSFEGLYELTFARSYQEMNVTRQKLKSPNIDSVWIYEDGKYGYSGIGDIPKRDIPEMGSFIKDGNSSLYDMRDHLKGGQRPILWNPKKGYVSMANNKFAEDSIQSRTSLHEISTGRSYRLENIIKEKIEKKEKFDFKDMVDMQLDVKDEFLSQAFPHVLKALSTVRGLWSNPQTQIYYERLLKWDYNMPKDSIEASIYHVWERHFQSQMLLSFDYSLQEYESLINHAFFEVYQMRLFQKMGKNQLGHLEERVCMHYQNSNLTKLHPCLYNAAKAFKNLPEQLHKLFKSSNLEDYKWGKIHKTIYKSLPWSEIPLIKNIYQRETQSGGNSRTLNVAIFSHQRKDYNAFAGPIIRLVTDLNRTLYSYDTGSSDRPWSKYYGNFVGKDLYIEYVNRNPILESVPDWQKRFDSL